MMKRAILFCLSFAIAACATTSSAGPGGPSGFSASEQSAAARINAHEMEGHIRFLSSDLLEGRFPGQRGDAIAIQYLADQLEAMGLVGGAKDKDGKPSFIQDVPLVRYTSSTPDQVELQAGGQKLTLPESGDNPEIVV